MEANGNKGQALYALKAVTKSYGSGNALVTALDAVDLTISRGEFAAIVGPSGSGKTTLLQLLGALDKPTSGKLLFESRELTSYGESELAELRLRRIGFVFQQFNLIPTLSAAQNIEAALAPAESDGALRVQRISELLERVGLADRASHLPQQLSGGEQQRVAIARALANRPDVLLADEPTGNLDTATGESVVSLLGELVATAGISCVLITHDSHVAEAAQRVLSMRDGKIESDSADPAPDQSTTTEVAQ